MQTLLLLILAITIPIFYLFRHFLTPKHDQTEPPIVSPNIPVVGHIIGLMRKKAYYYLELRC